MNRYLSKIIGLSILSIFLSGLSVYAEDEDYLSFKDRKMEGSLASEYLYNLGRERYNRGDYWEAIGKFKRVLLINPDHKGAIEYLRRSIAKLEKLPKAKMPGIPIEIELEELLEKGREEAVIAAIEKAEKLVEEFPAEEVVVVKELERLPEERRTPLTFGGLPLPPVKISGEYRVGIGATSEDFMWKEANADLMGVPHEKNWRYLWGPHRHNTYDPKIYDRLRLDIKTDTRSGYDGYAQIVVDPWTFIGTTSAVTLPTWYAGTNGNDPVEIQLKYWSNTAKTINEIVRTQKGDLINIPEISVDRGKTKATTAWGSWDKGTAWQHRVDITSLDIDRMYRPIRKFWLGYKEDEYSVRVFLMADQSQALTSDDPLRLSNNRLYWEESPWLDEYEPSLVFSPRGSPPSETLKKGRWIRRFSFFAKDSDQARLTFLRGASLSAQFLGDAFLEATVATPMNLWDEYTHITSIPAAVRFKKEVNDALILGAIYTFKMGLDGGKREALNQVLGIDASYEISPAISIFSEVARGNTDIEEATGYKTSYDGYASKIGILSKVGAFDTELFLTHMDEDFYPALSNYRYTRRDQHYSKHITFAELDSKDKAIRIGDSVDRGRDVVGLTAQAKLLDGRLDTFLNLRNARRDNGDYIETVGRIEANYKITSKLASKALVWYKHLPETETGYDPFIYAKTSYSLIDYFSEEDVFLENALIEKGKDPSIGTFSGGLRYDFNEGLALEGIYEWTNDPLDFPRGLINDVYVTDQIRGGIRWDKVVPFLYDQEFFELPPYKYYNIGKARLIYKPTSSLIFTVSHVYNENKHASGIDDNINHSGIEIDYKLNEKLDLWFKYIYSKLIDVYKQNKLKNELGAAYESNMVRGKFYEGHHNTFIGVRYYIDEDRSLDFLFGEFLAYDDPYLPSKWSLSTLDTQRLVRIFYTGKF